MNFKRLFLILILSQILFAQSPLVENIRFEQRTDGSLLVDIYYDVSDADDDALYVRIAASDDEGATWDLPCKRLIGDVGYYISPGTNKQVVWDFYADNPDTSGTAYMIGVEASDILCGMTITSDITLSGDIECEPLPVPAMMIGASDITLDLGGHTLNGHWDMGIHEAIIAQDVDDVTITNGTIDNFTSAVVLINSNSSVIEDISITNLENDDAEVFASGILVSGSQGVTVKDCNFEFLYVHHKQAVSLGNSNVTVDNIELNGGSVGVDFGGTIGFTPSSGTVMNSRFVHNIIGGILIQGCTSALIRNNIFDRSNITANPAFEGTAQGITIEDNVIYDTGEAIWFLGCVESTISNNTISNSLIGISIDQSKGCIHNPDVWDCFYSTNNLISNNTVLGNNLDLYHHELCTGNVWEGNIAETKQGMEIYSSDPATARDFLDVVDSVATSIAPDAQLVHASSGGSDTTGVSYRWGYIYVSEIQQEDYEFWYHDGQVVDRGSPTDSININMSPFSGPWIDSDSAIVITDDMGGREFRETFELDHIEMGVQEFGWTVHYFFQDTVFTVEFNALIE